MNEVTAGSIVSGPITGGSRGRPFAASMLDFAAHGYTEAEYLLEGTATRYQLAPGAELTRDGRAPAALRSASSTSRRSSSLVNLRRSTCP